MKASWRMAADEGRTLRVAAARLRGARAARDALAAGRDRDRRGARDAEERREPPPEGAVGLGLCRPRPQARAVPVGAARARARRAPRAGRPAAPGLPPGDARARAGDPRLRPPGAGGG